MKYFVLSCAKPFQKYNLLAASDYKLPHIVQTAYDSVVYLDRHIKAFSIVEIYCNLKAFVIPANDTKLKAAWLEEDDYNKLVKKYLNDESAVVENLSLLVSMDYAKIKGICSAGLRQPEWLVSCDLSALDGIAKPPNCR